MAEELKTFLDIQKACREVLGIQAGDTNAATKIKRAINRIYINKIVPGIRWFWLRQTVQIVHPKKYTGESSTTTASVTEDSTTVILSDSVAASLGSFANYRIKIGGFDEEYEISTHAQGTAAIVLKSAYQGTTNAETAFTIWRDRIDLPTDCRETMDVWHDRHDRPMDGRGPQEFRVIRLANRGREGFPIIYNTDDFFDPTSGTPETEADRFRQTEIYPARSIQDVTINVQYIQEAASLDLDADEPLMPIEDRDVIVDGALSILWNQLARNTDEATLSRRSFEDKLKEMAARVEDSHDSPAIAPDTRYIAGLRRISDRNRFRDF